MALTESVLSPDFLQRGDDLKDFFLFLLKVSLNKQARDTLGAAEANYIKVRTKELAPLVTGNANPSALQALRDNGFYVPPNVFSPSEIESIHRHLAGRTLAWHNHKERGSAVVDEVPAESISAHYDKRAVLSCPEFARCVLNPTFIRMMSEFLGAPATISSVTSWWSYPVSVEVGHQLYHHDRGDFRSCNLFVYLTDVDEMNGAHSYVVGSHDSEHLRAFANSRFAHEHGKNLFFEWLEQHRKRDKDVVTAFTSERIINFVGPAGTSFFEDTRGLHKLMQLRSGRRLAFEICYTLLPKYTETFEPISRADLGLEVEELDPLTRYATRLIYA